MQAAIDRKAPDRKNDNVNKPDDRHSPDLLLSLCDRQLLCTTRDAEGVIARVTADLTFAIRAMSILGDSLAEHSGLPEHELNLFSLMERSFNRVLKNLQFFDAHYQRVGHVREALALLREGGAAQSGEGSDGEGGGRDLEAMVKAIFSIQSEHEVLREFFPQLAEERQGESVEIFHNA